MPLAGERPSTLLRSFFRIPLYLHRIGLGGWERVLGVRFMLITTTGRRTGKPHRVIVDVLDHDQNEDVYYTQSAYGERSDWVRNIKANPVFEAEVGERRFKATAKPVPGTEASERLWRYICRHRLYAEVMMRTVRVDLGDYTEEELRSKLGEELVLAIKPIDGMVESDPRP